MISSNVSRTRSDAGLNVRNCHLFLISELP